MKSFLTILFISCSICQIGFGQVVRGQLVDRETNQPAIYANIQIENTTRGCTVDSMGYFSIDLEQNETLIIWRLEYFYHRMTNNLSHSDTVNLGKIVLVPKGFSGYVSIEKKRLFSKKTRLICKYVDGRKNFNPNDLEIKCSNGSSNYTWKLVDDDTLFINLSELNNCQ